MNKLCVTFFAFIGWATYANNDMVDVIKTLDTLENNTSILVEKVEEKKEVIKDNEVAFEYYYTMDWLYEETPFIYKLEVLV